MYYKQGLPSNFFLHTDKRTPTMSPGLGPQPLVDVVVGDGAAAAATVVVSLLPLGHYLTASHPSKPPTTTTTTTTITTTTTTTTTATTTTSTTPCPARETSPHPCNVLVYAAAAATAIAAATVMAAGGEARRGVPVDRGVDFHQRCQLEVLEARSGGGEGTSHDGLKGTIIREEIWYLFLKLDFSLF